MDGSHSDGYEVRDLALSAGSREEVFARLARMIDVDPGAVVAALERREADGGTAVGGGVAIPHAAVAGLDHGVLVDMRLASGVRWDRAHGDVRRCLCVLVPEGRHDTHAALLAEAARRVAARPRVSAATGKTQPLPGLSQAVAAARARVAP